MATLRLSAQAQSTELKHSKKNKNKMTFKKIQQVRGSVKRGLYLTDCKKAKTLGISRERMTKKMEYLVQYQSKVVRLRRQLQKLPLKAYDKVFYYYLLQMPLHMYAHKTFILLEMQLNIMLVRSKLAPYLFMVRDLCFYRLVQLNQTAVNNPYQILSLYDSLMVPIYLHNYMYYRQYRIQYYPANINHFFKKY